MVLEKLWDRVTRDWGTLMSVRGGWVSSLVLCAVVAAAAGWRVADYHYSGRIDALKETLDTKEFPKPIIKTVAVPTATDDHRIDGLEVRMAALESAGHGQVTSKGIASNPTPPPRSSNVTASGGGVAMGSGGSIETVNQNGLPARSVFARQLGEFYTGGYLMLQSVSTPKMTDDQLSIADGKITKWRNEAVTWLNANMCSDAAAYFLKPHRASLTYGFGQRQDNIFDTLSWSLDNLSDMKRNDAWDCK